MKTKMKKIGLALVLGLAAAAVNAGQTTYYIYDEAGHVIGEYDQDGHPIQEHVYLGDRPLAVVQNGDANNIGYVTTDQQNTPRAITDSQQNVVWTWNSDPYGNTQPTGSMSYNLRSAGQYYDAETGHSYNYFRDYDPATGRYIESDPSGLQGGINTYAYVLDNPLSLVDPLGLCGDSPSAPPAPSPDNPAGPTPPDGGGDAHWNCLKAKWKADEARLEAWYMQYGDPSANFTNSLSNNFQNDVSSQGRSRTSIVANGDMDAVNDVNGSLIRGALEAEENPAQAAITVGEQTPNIYNETMDVGTGVLALGQTLLGNDVPPLPTILPDDKVCPP